MSDLLALAVTPEMFEIALRYEADVAVLRADALLRMCAEADKDALDLSHNGVEPGRAAG